MYASSPYSAASGKRKRDHVDDGDVEMPEDYVSDEDASSDDDEPDEEELREQRARARKAKTAATKTPATKKPKASKTAALPIRSAGATKKRAPKVAKQLNNLDAEEAGGLFAEVFAHKKEMQEIVRGWCDVFADNESDALVEIINFVLRAAGCVGKVTSQDVEDPDAVTSKIMDLQDEFQASNPTDYPLMAAKGKTARTVKDGVTAFLDVLIKSTAQTGQLFEGPELMENIQVWFSTMSTAANRPFRHTATVVSLTVVTVLSEVCRDVANEAAKDVRQAETERKKSAANKKRVKEIEQKAEAARHRQDFLEGMLKDWFDTVFVHRYKDIDASIRRECAAALGDWIVTMPGVYLDGQHLRYMGWMLSDVHSSVRMETVKQLIRLYKLPDMIGGLKTFTERFRGRLVELATSDAESSVRVVAIELLDLLRENGLLEPDDVDAVGRLIFEADDKVRKATARFLAESINELYTSKLDDVGGADALDEALPLDSEHNYEIPRLEWLKLKCVAEMLHAYHNEETLPGQMERSRSDGGLILHAAAGDSRFSLAGGDLYDRIPELRDRRLLSGYLLFDSTSGGANGVSEDVMSRLKHECILTEKEEIVLLELLNASVRRELTTNAEKFVAAKSKLSKRQKADLQEDQEEAARDLASLIPKLLEKFGDSPETASSVLRLEKIFSLPLLQDLRQDSATYGTLLDNIRKQFMSHTSDNVLEPATKAILHAKSNGELDEVTEEKIASLWDDVVLNFVQLIDPDTLSERGTASTGVLTALSDSLLRIVRLSSVSDPTLPLEDPTVISSLNTGEDINATIDCVLALVQHAKTVDHTAIDAADGRLEDELAIRAAEAALFYFQWRLRSIRERVQSPTSTDIPYDELEALATRRDSYSELLSSILRQRSAKDEICAAIAGDMLDLHAASATLSAITPRPGASDDYTVFVMDLDRSKQKEVMKAFVGAEKSYAKLSKKTLEEPSVDSNGDEGLDTFDDDPMSDPESDDDDDEPSQSQSQSQASQQRKEAKLIATILAEQRLCQLTSKIIYAVLAGIMEPEATRQRVERNRGKLGLNFKEVCAYFDVEEAVGKKKRGQARAKGKGMKASAAPGANGAQTRGNGKGKAGRKSNAIVAESEEEDEIEDEDEEQEALRRRELVDVEDDGAGGEDAVNGAHDGDDDEMGD